MRACVPCEGLCSLSTAGIPCEGLRLSSLATACVYYENRCSPSLQRSCWIFICYRLVDPVLLVHVGQRRVSMVLPRHVLASIRSRPDTLLPGHALASIHSCLDTPLPRHTLASARTGLDTLFKFCWTCSRLYTRFKFSPTGSCLDTLFKYSSTRSRPDMLLPRYVRGSITVLAR